MIGIPAAKCVEADGLIAEIDLTANQTMRPQWIDLKGMTKQADRAGFGGATYEDHHSLGVNLEIGLPGEKQGTALGRTINPCRSALAVGPDVAAGLRLKAGQGIMVEATPHLGLPTAVEVFDGSLEAGLPGRCEHRGHAQLQADPDNAAQGVATAVATLEDCVVVELCISGQPELTPVLQKRRHRAFGAHQPLRPGRWASRRAERRR